MVKGIGKGKRYTIQDIKMTNDKAQMPNEAQNSK